MREASGERLRACVPICQWNLWLAGWLVLLRTRAFTQLFTPRCRALVSPSGMRSLQRLLPVWRQKSAVESVVIAPLVQWRRRVAALAMLERELPQYLDLDSWQMTLAQFIQSQPRRAYTISPESTVFEAVQKMVAHNVGAVAVVEPDANDAARQAQRLVGIFTERDYLRKIIVASKASKTTPIAEVMTQDPVCVTPQQRVGDALHLMTELDIRHLPVLESLPNGSLLTMVSMRQLMREVAASHEKQVSALMAQLRKLSLLVVDDRSPGDGAATLGPASSTTPNTRTIHTGSDRLSLKSWWQR